MKYFVQTMDAIISHSNQNIFLDRIINNVYTLFIVYIIISLVLFAATIPIVYKIQSKIGDIYGLLSKISPF